MASNGNVNVSALGGVLVGSSLVIASACVFNNYIDRNLDAAMARTKQRALVRGSISARNALLFASLLGLVGFSVLIILTNWLTVAIGAVAFVCYVSIYGLAKRRSVHGTLVGTIPGAASIVAGYVAAAGRLDTAVLLLFAILVGWQMAHFYSIAMYRVDDYRAAAIPVFPVKRGMAATKRWIIGYIGGFILAVLLLHLFGYTGWAYVLVMLIVSLTWLGVGLTGLRADTNDKRWARQMFKLSLWVLLSFSIMISVNTLVP